MSSVRDDPPPPALPTPPVVRASHLIASGLLLALLVAVGVIPRLIQHASLSQDVAGAVAKPQVVVTQPHLVADTGISLPANMQAVDETILSARMTGYLTKYLVDIGSHVRRGQLMAVLEAPDADQQTMQARAQNVQTLAAVEQSRSNELQLSAATSAARAVVAQDRAQLSHSIAAEAQAAAQLSAAERNMAQAEAERDKAHEAELLAYRSWQRIKGLFAEGFDTVQDADQTEAAWKEAKSDTIAAQRTVDAAHATVRAQEAAVNTARADVVASQALVDSGIENMKAAAAAQKSGLSAIDAADATQKAADYNMQRFQTLQGFEKVVAPFDGVVTTRYADAGTLITADGSKDAYLFGVARTEMLRVQVRVPENYALPMRVGLAAVIKVKELPGKEYPGTVTKVASSLDPATRTELVEVWTKNADGKLLPGMYANVNLKPYLGPSMRISGTALITDKRGTGVDVVGDTHRVHFQKIDLGRDFGTEVEVVQGLDGKETLVDNPTDTLREGQEVEVVPAQAEKAP